MNLLDRAFAAASSDNIQAPLLQELAGEVERLWAFEKDYAERLYPAWQATKETLHENLRQTRSSLEAEIVELKAKTDTEGMMRRWLEGYTAAASQFQSILFNLLRATDSLGPEPTEDHHHE